MAICEICELTDDICVCSDADKCVGCEFYDGQLGCVLEPPHNCVKEI